MDNSVPEINTIPELHFIVGLGRSGTTLLSSHLNKHPNVVAPPESLFLLYFYNYFKKKKLLNRQDKILFEEEIFKLKTGRFVNLDMWFIDKPTLHHDLEKIPANGTYMDLIGAVYKNSLAASGKKNITHLIDKNPPYTLHIDKLAALSSTTKFIGLIRDYRDNALSRHTYRLDSKNNFIYHGLNWQTHNKALLSAAKKYPDRVLLVRYEDLVRNFDEYLKRIKLFLGIPEAENFIPGSVQEKEQQLNLLLSEEEKKILLNMHGRVNEVPDDSKIGIWKKELAEKSVIELEYICGETGKEFVYETSTVSRPGFSFFLRLFAMKLYFRLDTIIHFSYYASPLFLRKFAGRIRKFFGRKRS